GRRIFLQRFQGPPQRPRPGAAPGPVPGGRLPGPLRGPYSPHASGELGFLRCGRGGRAEEVDLGGVPRAALRRYHHRHPLRHQVVEVRHPLGGRLGGHPARGHGDVRRVPHGLLRRRLHDQPAAGGGNRRQGVGSLRLRRGAPGARARRPGPSSGAAPVLLEERQVGQGPQAHARGRARLLGVPGLPQPRGPLDGAALLGRL
ncbi:MAG: conserved hypothetical protein, partial [uncultured Rubrobacteraceae bacterium]